MNGLCRGRVQRAMVFRPIALALVVFAPFAPFAALADAPKDAPAPCVNRGGGLVRPIHDVTLDAKTLAFCTGDDCWTLDRATNAVAAAPKVIPAPAKPSDPAGML